MTGTINNFNSTIINQVVGVQHNTPAGSIDYREQLFAKLDEIARHVAQDASIDKLTALAAMQATHDIRREVALASPSVSGIERSLSVLGSIASLASVAEPIRLFIGKMLSG